MYTFNSRIRYSEADCSNRLTIEGLLNYFQDCSTFQSEDLGVGLKYLKERDMAWVLNMWQIDVLRYPEVGERVEIGTLPYDIRGFLGYRNFWMADEQGNRLAVANTIWTLLNLEKGKPVMAPQEMKDAYQTAERMEMEYLPRKIAIPDGGKKMPEFVITRHYLDTNNHVNNGRYVQMAMEYPEDDFKISRLRAEYKKQAYQDDIFCPVVCRQEKVYTISFRNESGELYAVVELTGK